MRKQQTSIAAWLGLSGAIAAFAGGAEHFCGAAGTNLIESWVVPPTGIRFEIARLAPAGSTDFLIAPNYPSQTTCAATGASSQTWPGVQSLINALSAWNGITAGGQPVSTFAFSPTASFITVFAANPATILNTGNGINTVSYFEPTIASTGGLFVLATTRVIVQVGSTISEADIAVNTSLLSSGANAFSFVETNSTAFPNQTFATNGAATFAAPITTYTDPAISYFDLQGILTHELGHAAGLAHSLVDAQTVPGSSQMPTMAPLPTGTPSFAATVQLPQYPTSTFIAATASSAPTAYQGIYATGSRTIERDDIFAISEAYPGLGLNSLGRIRGVVTDNTGAPVLGCHVVAISTTAPDTNRVGTLTYSGGRFDLRALPAGTYTIYVEPVDANGFFTASGPAGANPTTLQLPNYVQPPGNCVFPTAFTSELYDTNAGGSDGVIEPLPMSAALISVGAGTTSSIAVRVNNILSDTLYVQDQNTLIQSPRGVTMTIQGPSTAPPTVTTNTANLLIVAGTVPPPGTVAVFAIGVGHVSSIVSGQLLQVGVAPSFFFVPFSGGTASMSVPVSLVGKQFDFIVQGSWIDPTLGTVLTNPASIYVF